MTASTLAGFDVTTAAAGPFDEFETVGLAEVNARAALQTRVDRKYLVAAYDLVGLIDHLRAPARVLELHARRHSDYTSTYFDTPTFDSYLAAARSRPNRFKARVRTYLDDDAHHLEVKTRSRRRHTTKTRCSAVAEDHEHLSASGKEFVVETLSSQLPDRPGLSHAAAAATLRPTLNTHYRRTTLLVESETAPSGMGPAVPSRATIDTSLAFAVPGHARSLYPDVVIVETKTAGPPSPVDRLLWRFGHRPLKISKFGIGVAVFHPDLPATKWNRVLRRNFGWKPGSTLAP